MNTFFWSDLHLGHENILKLCHRPDRSVEEMDERLIAAWNGVVRKGDWIWYLGDFTFKSSEESWMYLKRLNGHIMMLPGNHDDDLWRAKGGLNLLGYSAGGHDVISYPSLHVIKINHQKIVLCHYPLREWDGYYRGAIHLYGHVHGTLTPRPGSRDMGVDSNPRPVEFEELKGLIVPVDPTRRPD